MLISTTVLIPINDLFNLILSPLGHIQVSQVPGRHEPDENGEINFPFFFKSLVSLGYDGWIGCEYRPAGSLASPHTHKHSYHEKYYVTSTDLSKLRRSRILNCFGSFKIRFYLL